MSYTINVVKTATISCTCRKMLLLGLLFLFSFSSRLVNTFSFFQFFSLLLLLLIPGLFIVLSGALISINFSFFTLRIFSFHVL